jgi:hypothetical protein
MKKTLTTLTILGIAVALPAFAADAKKVTHTEKTTYTEQVTYHKVRVPLTADQIAERQRLITKIEHDIKKIDFDNDHQVSFEEYTTGEQRLHTDGKELTESFNSIDKNGDGLLSSQEILDSQWAQIENSHTPVIATTQTEKTTYTTR